MKKERTRKKASKGQRLFQIVNTVLIVGIIGFYVFRLFYYKDYFDKQYYALDDSNLLYERVQSKIEVGATDGLFKTEDGGYIFRGKVDNNYVLFDNRLFRIVSITENSAIKVVSEKSISNLPLSEAAGFEDTSLFNWLNKGDKKGSGVYSATFTDAFGTLDKITNDINTVDDLSTLKVNNTEKNYLFSLLTIDEYRTSGGRQGFLNNGESFWLANSTSDGQHWFVNNDGDLSLSSGKAELNGARVVMTLNYQTEVLEGSGTKDAPYVIESEATENIGSTYVGQYVSYGSNLWRVCGHDEAGNAILFMNGYVKDSKGTDVLMGYGSKNEYDTSSKSSIAYYLNNTFLKTLPSYKTLLVESDWQTGTFQEADIYSLEEAVSDKYHCYVGIPNISFLFLNEYPDIFLSNTGFESHHFVYIVSDSNLIYQSLLADEHHLRPVICMKGTVAINSGKGTIEEPYVAEVN